MEMLLFSWDEDSMCWECTLSDEKIYMYKCPPSQTFMYTQRNNDTHATYGIFDSSHEAQKYLYVKYNKEVRYRDPHEVNYPRRDLLEQYI